MARSVPARLRLEALETRDLLAGLVGGLVTFGDSLSDVGNSSLGSGGQFPPAALYYQGRFSGGPIWIDKLAQYLGEPAVQPALAGGLDYAFGGASVAYDNTTPPFDTVPTLPEQVGLYLQGNAQLGLAPHTPAADDLFALLGGPNDFFFSLAQTGTPIDPTTVAATLVGAVSTLYAAGGRNFAVANLPPLGQIPYFQDALKAGAIPQAVVDGADQWSAGFDLALKAGLDQFAQAHPDAKVVQVDTAGLFAKFQDPSNPFGFANRTDAVGPFGSSAGGGGLLTSITVADTDSYLYYDGVHPGTLAQQALGRLAAADVFAAGIAHKPPATGVVVASAGAGGAVPFTGGAPGTTPFAGFAGEVRVASGDVNGDGTADVIYGAGPGAPGGHVKVFDGVTGAEIRSFFAFDGFSGGVNVGAGDINGDGYSDVIVGAGAGAPGGHVKVFDGRTGAEVRSFFAFDGFAGGVTVAGGDIDGDGRADIIVGAGPGATGGHVKVFSGVDVSLLRSFFAYNGFTGGVFVGAADLDSDGKAEILAGEGAGGEPHVRAFGASDAAILDFLAYDAAFRGGVRVAGLDLDGDGTDEIITGSGPGARGNVRAFDPTGAALDSFFATAAGSTAGVIVG